MIEVQISHDGNEIARIRISREPFGDFEASDYLASFGVEKSGPMAAVGLYTRTIHSFPRLRRNALALVKEALSLLDEGELSLDEGTVPSDLAWKVRRVSPALQAWASGLRNH